MRKWTMEKAELLKQIDDAQTDMRNLEASLTTLINYGAVPDGNRELVTAARVRDESHNIADRVVKALRDARKAIEELGEDAR